MHLFPSFVEKGLQIVLDADAVVDLSEACSHSFTPTIYRLFGSRGFAWSRLKADIQFPYLYIPGVVYYTGIDYTNKTKTPRRNRPIFPFFTKIHF